MFFLNVRVVTSWKISTRKMIYDYFMNQKCEVNLL